MLVDVPFWPHPLETSVDLHGRVDHWLPFIMAELTSAGLLHSHVTQSVHLSALVEPVLGREIRVDLFRPQRFDAARVHQSPIQLTANRAVRLLAQWGDGPQTVPPMLLFAILDKARDHGFAEPYRPIFEGAAAACASATPGRLRWIDGQYAALARVCGLHTETEDAA